MYSLSDNEEAINLAQAEILAEKFLYTEEPTATMVHHSVDQEHLST